MHRARPGLRARSLGRTDAADLAVRPSGLGKVVAYALAPERSV